MLSLRAHAFICGFLFFALIGIAIAGNVLQAAGVFTTLGDFQLPAQIAFLTLFLAFGLSTIPVIVKLVLAAQVRLGNANVPLVAALIRRQNAIIWVMWGVIVTGLSIAVPAMIADGFFGSAPGHVLTIEPRSEGTLVARPGMTFAEMARRSTLKLAASDPSVPVAGGAVFDFQIPGTGVTLTGCRYYFVTPYTHQPGRIESLSIGTSPHKISRGELEGANAALRARLAADGWLTGHEEYRDEQDRQLHGGLTRGPEGRLWLKDGMVFSIDTRRFDDPKDGEDPATAGEWIQFIGLWARDDYPGIERYAFAAPDK